MITSHSPGETFEAAQQFAAALESGAVIALCGDLGAGKTQFVKGLAAGLGCDAPVTSPTFTLVNEYPGGRLPLYHIDLYRLDTMEEAVRAGIEEYLPADGITAVEWADKFPALFPAGTRWLRFDIGENDQRTIEGQK